MFVHIKIVFTNNGHPIKLNKNIGNMNEVDILNNAIHNLEKDVPIMAKTCV